jgi:hypothetical protein
MSWGGVEQRIDIKEHREETTHSGFANWKRHVAMTFEDSDPSIFTAN